jgi:hypothetical protein
MAANYIVAFRGISSTNGYKGVITWTPYADKAEFDAWWAKQDKTLQEVVEEGITSERAVELTLSTPIQSRLNAAVMDARNPDTGDFNGTLLMMNLAKLEYFQLMHPDAK